VTHVSGQNLACRLENWPQETVPELTANGDFARNSIDRALRAGYPASVLAGTKAKPSAKPRDGSIYKHLRDNALYVDVAARSAVALAVPLLPVNTVTKWTSPILNRAPFPHLVSVAVSR
jgi:hypothetical protein